MNHEWTGMSPIVEQPLPLQTHAQKDFANQNSDSEMSGLKTNGVSIEFKNGHRDVFDAVCLCLGGASWEPESPLRWPQIFETHHIAMEDFKPTNTGWHVDLSPKIFSEVEGEPLKNIVFTSTLGSKKGDLVVTNYGFEGTPVYIKLIIL